MMKARIESRIGFTQKKEKKLEILLQESLNHFPLFLLTPLDPKYLCDWRILPNLFLVSLLIIDTRSTPNIQIETFVSLLKFDFYDSFGFDFVWRL
jgi:hypothetical protein